MSAFPPESIDDTEPFSLTFAPEEAGTRLDKALAERIPDLSRERLKGLIAEGALLVDGRIELNGARKIRGGEAITLTLPDLTPATPVPEAIPLDILFEDEALVVVNKAAGMVVHPSNGHERGTLVNALLHHCGASLSGINGVLRPGIVHRLDKDTSGVMVVAKGDKAHKHLAAQFADHGRTNELERVYRAICWGTPPRKVGTIEAAIARSTQNRERMVVSRAESARFAITHYAVEAVTGDAKAPLASLISCQLETGRTHQIRVHLAHIGNPLLGDALYGSGFRTREKHLPEVAQTALQALNRQALHAETLQFEHPLSGEVMSFERAPPADFVRLQEALFGSLG
jgi:23S rRNA pseudouridine1911/1915/1917 synthase